MRCQCRIRDNRPSQARRLLRFSPRCTAIFGLGTLLLLAIPSAQFSLAQGLAVRNPKHLAFPEAEAARIYQSAADAVQKEFQQTEALRPQFTLVLGADRDSVDVDSKELRLVKWDKILFTKGAILFTFEQLMPEQRSARLTRRVISEANATITPEEVRA